MAGVLAGCTFAHEHDIRDYRRPFAFECIGWQANRADKIGFIAEILAQRSVLLIFCGLCRYVVLLSFPANHVAFRRFLHNISASQ
jgi:hypothetical protein